MAGVPIFIEVEETRNQADSRLCCKVVDLLFEKHIAPVGLVGTVEDTSALLQETRSHGLSPAIFVINTLGARPILPGLDILIGELPVLYFRRRLFAGKSGLMDQLLVGGQDVLQTSTVLGKLTPRLTSMWFYGTKNSDEIAKRAASALMHFLDDGDFLHIERAGALVDSL